MRQWYGLALPFCDTTRARISIAEKSTRTDFLESLLYLEVPEAASDIG
jgi:hypothetical protein